MGGWLTPLTLMGLSRGLDDLSVSVGVTCLAFIIIIALNHHPCLLPPFSPCHSLLLATLPLSSHAGRVSMHPTEGRLLTDHSKNLTYYTIFYSQHKSWIHIPISLDSSVNSVTPFVMASLGPGSMADTHFSLRGPFS